MLGIDVCNVDAHRKTGRWLIEVEKHALVGNPSMAGYFDPFSIGDVSAKEIATADRAINRRLGPRVPYKTPARQHQQDNKLRFRGYCSAALWMPRYERHGFHIFRGCNTHNLSNDDVIQVGRI